MGVNELFRQQLKASSQNSVAGSIDNYLFKQSNKPNDRAINVNAPSAAGGCMRATYYSRMQYPTDNTIDPRTQRIFDNGSHVHLRLQEYLLKMHLLVMDEVPLINDKYRIQGHTDGYLDFGDEIAILEIKSINDNQFRQLKDAKPEHKCQGLIYLYCAEERRLYLHKKYPTQRAFEKSSNSRKYYFEQHYQHMKSGKKYKREEKIAMEVALNMESDEILYAYDKPVNKVVFLYENKNDQNLKEFTVTRDDKSQELLENLLKGYEELNDYCELKKIPSRPKGVTKSSSPCRWCDYKNECWTV